VVDTDSGVLTSDIGSFSDEDILAEFREENQMEVDVGDDGNEDEQQEETPKRPRKSEVGQAVETLSRYIFFAVEGAEFRRQTSQLSFTIDKSMRKKTKTTEHSKIFQCNSVCSFIRRIIIVFFFLSVSFFVLYCILLKIDSLLRILRFSCSFGTRYFKLFSISFGTLK